LVDGGRPELAAALDELVKHYRDLSEQHDRQLVAREIRRLVAVSGLSQRQFAALCGTSAPRLSTYVNGLVTPSAAMMVRFTRVSERAQRQAAQERGSTA
jgi:DNA transposition AAA+ family ATPase